MLFVLIALILLAGLAAIAGLMLLSARLFKVKKFSYPKALKLTLLGGLVSLISVLGFKYPDLDLLLTLVSIVVFLLLIKWYMRIGWGKAIGVYVVTAILSLFVLLPMTLSLHAFAFQAFTMEGTSMEPEINKGDYLITSKAEKTIAGASYAPKLGQIVAYRFPENVETVVVQRVVAVPGDKVVLENGKLTIYNKDNPSGSNAGISYKVGAGTAGDFDKTVPAGEVFVVSDNPTSQFFIPTANIISVVKYRISPSFKSY